jgi:all-trans-retinol 13,14-reductase
VHYVGEVNKEHSILRDIFDYVSDGKLKWAEMDDVYDEIIIGANHIHIAKAKRSQSRPHQLVPGRGEGHQ